MKKLFLIIVSVLMVSTSLFAQGKALQLSRKENTVISHKDSLVLGYLDSFHKQLREPMYKLYPTKNTWNFIKLNTATGQMWMVQFSIDDSPRMEYVLNDDIRISNPEEMICGRFELYPTNNTYNFILLDNIDGRCWQVQWSFEKENRMVMRIY